VPTFKLPRECARGACHVYLIEDEASLRAELAETLKKAGLEVLAFENAESCLDAGIDYSPAVIVSDMVLPGQSGIDLFQELREQGIETPLVFMSGYSEPRQIIEGMKLGVVDFLWKPFKSEALFEAIARALKLDLERQANLRLTSGVEARWATLSDREEEVCKLMLKGFGNKDIAEQLGIRPDTVNKHRMKTLKKMGVPGRPQLIELLKSYPFAQT
jgi:FixJ family two-component response regulator